MSRNSNTSMEQLWQECVTFHGHSCGGLAIGFKAALYALELLKMERSDDEEIVCIAENDSCGIDAIQYITGCTVGKSNLLFYLRGKQAWNFYRRETGQSVRLLLKEKKIPRDQMLALPGGALFDRMLVRYPLPEQARIFQSYSCEECGEMTADYFLRVQHGKKICLDCFRKAEQKRESQYRLSF